MRLAWLLLSLAAASPASAQPLWQNVEFGMNLAQLRALYPAGGKVSYAGDEVVLHDYAVTAKCSADVHIRLAAGSVKSVDVKGRSALDQHCAEAVQDGLSAKYGPPLTTGPHEGGSIFAHAGIAYSWNHDGVTLRFVRYPQSWPLPAWEIQYIVAANVPL